MSKSLILDIPCRTFHANREASNSRLNHVACRCIGTFAWPSRDIDTPRNEMMVFEHLYGIG